jgi:hypothetical protein
MINEYGWLGRFEIKTKNGIFILKNRIMNNAIDELLKALSGNEPDIMLKYLAMGTGTTGLLNTQTQLENEVFRTPFITITKTGIGRLTSIATILDVDYDGPINEVGVFCGDSATTSADTGLMLSRVLWNYTKTATEEIQITRYDNIERR